MANTLTAHQAIVVGQEALAYLKKNTFMAKLVTNFFGTEAQTVGNTIKVPKIGALTANNKTAGAAVTVQDATSTSVDIVLNQHKHATFVIEDFDSAVSSGNLTNYYINSALGVICEAVDASLTGLYAGLSQTVPVSANAVPITHAMLLAGRKQLSDAKAPLANRSMVLGTEAYSQLLALPEFVSAERYGNTRGIQEGSLGRIAGFDVFESQSIVTATADQNLMFHKRAFGIAVRPLPMSTVGDSVIQQVVTDADSGLSVRVTMGYNQDRLGVQTTIDVLYGVAELDDLMGTKLLS